MKLISVPYLFAAILAFGPLLAGAAEGAPRVLSWEQCVSLAAEQNAELLAARNAVDASRHQEYGAYSGYFPTLSGTLGYTRSGSQSLGTSSETSTSEYYSAGLSATQNLFSGLQTYGQTKQTKANRISAELAYEQAKAQLSYDLKTTFETYRFAKEYSRLTTNIVKRREENFKLVTLRYESGRENRGSVLLSEAYLNQARYDDLQASNALPNARVALMKAIGMDELSEFDISGEVPTDAGNPGAVDLKALALETPEYQRAASSEEAARAGIIVSRSTFFPTLGISGSIGRSGLRFFPNQTETWSVGTTLTFPFFSGGRDYHGLKSAISTAEAAESQRQGSLRSVLSKIQNSYSGYVEAIRRVEVESSFQRATATRAEIGRSKYNNGLLTFEDWDVIENDLIARQKSYLQSKRDRVTAEAAWELVRGKGVIQ